MSNPSAQDTDAQRLVVLQSQINARGTQTHHAQRLAEARAYRKAKKPWLTEASKAYHRKYRADHADKIREIQRRWAEKNRPSGSRVARTAIHDPCGYAGSRPYASGAPKQRTAEIKAANLARIRAVADKLRRGDRV